MYYIYIYIYFSNNNRSNGCSMINESLLSKPSVNPCNLNNFIIRASNNVSLLNKQQLIYCFIMYFKCTYKLPPLEIIYHNITFQIISKN